MNIGCRENFEALQLVYSTHYIFGYLPEQVFCTSVPLLYILYICISIIAFNMAQHHCYNILSYPTDIMNRTAPTLLLVLSSKILVRILASTCIGRLQSPILIYGAKFLWTTFLFYYYK